MHQELYPFKFEPVYKDYPWGGMRIPQQFNRKVPEGIYAESWEISDHPDGMSIVANGPLRGKTLRELLEKHAPEILGPYVEGNTFPLLIKLIDARSILSVQVHPNDETAAKHGGEAKTEAWYLLGDNPSQVFCGFKPGITKEAFLQAVADKRSSELLNAIPVQKDNTIFVQGGRVHAIDSGCLMLEVQQNSNTTYRIYDWDRTDAQGNSRPLHLEEAIKVIDWDDIENPLIPPKVIEETEGIKITEAVSCDYFRIEKIELTAPLETRMDSESFHALFIAEGNLTLAWKSGSEAAPAGTSWLIPASLTGYTLSGIGSVLQITV